MFNRSTLLSLVVLAIPFLAMLVMILKEEINTRRYPEYRIEITGYDPRNLLTGHFIRFNYKWPQNYHSVCAPLYQQCYACLNGPPRSANTIHHANPRAMRCQSAYFKNAIDL